MVKLILSDLDGTLLQNGARTIPEEIFTQIRRLRDKGIIFCPASGRQLKSLAALFAPVADGLCFICENGAAVFDGDRKLISKTVIDYDLALEICRAVYEVEGCELLVSGENTSYLFPKTPGFLQDFENFTGNNIVELDCPENVPEKMIKIAAHVLGGGQKLLDIADMFTARFGDRLNVALAGNNWVDFTISDKSTGVDAICAHFGVSPEDVMAFGDNFNDLAMLKKVGHPYIMESAHPDLLAQIPNKCKNVADVLKTL